MTSSIYIIRHGQTDLNLRRVLQGRSDQPLNETGIEQAGEAAERFRRLGISIDQIWSSPLQRAVQTARIVAGEDIPLTTDEHLLEMDYGPYEGASLLDPPEEILTFFSDFVNNPQPQGMESLDGVVQRLGLFLEEFREAPVGGNILLSTHAIAMKGALEYLTPDSGGSYWNTHIANCEVYVTRLENGIYMVPEPLGD